MPQNNKHAIDATSHSRNGKAFFNFTDNEDKIIASIEAPVEKRMAEIELTLTSFMARASTSRRQALFSDPDLRDVLFATEDRLLYEIAIPDRQKLIQRGRTPDSISHSVSKARADLKPIMTPYFRKELRSRKSWRCELAAIIIASYGKATNIPKAVNEKIRLLFGSETLNDAETNLIRKSMTAVEAKNWFKHLDDLNEVFKNAEIDKSATLSLVA